MSELFNFLEINDINYEYIPTLTRVHLDPREAFLYVLRGNDEFRWHPANRNKDNKAYIDTIDPKILSIIAKNPEAALHFALKFLNGVGWPPGEEAIASNPSTAYEYSHECIKKRFKAGEYQILASTYDVNRTSDFAINYADYVLGGRWKNLEYIILRDLPQLILRYCARIFNRDPKIERLIFDTDTPKIRWPEGEQALLSKASKDERFMQNCVDYAMKILHTRWPELEDLLVKGKTKDAGHAATSYVMYVIPMYKAASKGLPVTTYRSKDYQRWPELEQTILLDPWSVYYYIKTVLDDPESATLYIWPEGEDSIATHAEASLAYATQYLHDRFVKGEKVMKQDDNIWTIYLTFLKDAGYDVPQSPWAQS